jgi:FolB domain-containing protein
MVGDCLILDKLKVSAINGVDGWERSKEQPIVLSLKLGLDIVANDQIELNYSTVAKEVTAFASNSKLKSMEQLAVGIADLCLQKTKWVQVRLEKPRALLHADAAGILITRPKTDQEPDQVYIKNLKVNAILGINPWERETKQQIIFNLTLYDMEDSFSYRTIARVLDEYVQSSSFKTVEALVSEVARVAVQDCGVRKITVKLQKPSALLFAKGKLYLDLKI